MTDGQAAINEKPNCKCSGDLDGTLLQGILNELQAMNKANAEAYTDFNRELREVKVQLMEMRRNM